jgi:hypothetical protein
MRRILFPVRSCAGYFESQETVSVLEKQIKLSLVCFDEILFENGSYSLVVAEHGNFGYFTPPENISEESRKLSFGKGGNYGLKYADFGSNDYTNVNLGSAKISYRADFYPILKQADIINEEYIKQPNWSSDGKAREEIKEELKKQSQADKSNTNLINTLGGDVSEKDYLIDGYHHDFYLAHQLGVAVAFDERIERFIAAKNKQIALQLIPDVSSLVFDAALKLAIPDFRELSWKKIHEIRQSSVGRSFREMLYRIQANVVQELTNIQSPQDVREIVQKNFTRELFDEMSQFMPTTETVTFGLMFSLASLSFSPLGFVGNVNDAQNLIKRNQSWISLLKR